MMDQDNKDENFMPHNPFDSDDSFIENIIQDDKTGTIQITFDDGTVATSHGYATMGKDTAEMLRDTFLCANKAAKWLKKNAIEGKRVQMGMMLQTSMALGSVSQMLYHSCLAMSEEQTERMMNQ